ncbi:MAG: hypothetical protein LC637_05645 [Xanthomonadaceae bacterium]|nr:hypothetical protein [Xanthomonadaceae bacterium]
MKKLEPQIMLMYADCKNKIAFLVAQAGRRGFSRKTKTPSGGTIRQHKGNQQSAQICGSLLTMPEPGT